MNRNKLIVLIIFAFIFLFLFTFFAPRYMFSMTTTSGGDTGSHYPTAVYLKEVLLPRAKIMGWEQGNYAGFPVLYHYFPLTFILMVLISYIIPMQIAFKIVTVLGTFLLPICVYYAFKFLKYPFPIPIMGAVFSLPFLFLETNSMWGGNIPSTLAGEYSYSLSLSLMVLFFGSLYSGIENKDKIIPNAIIFFLIGFSHGFTMIFSGVIALFFLFSKKDFWPNLVYLFKVFSLGGLLFSFWFIPFLANMPYVTSYVARWHITSIAKVLPLILIPFYVLTLISFFLNIFDRRTRYFGYTILMALILYFVAPHIGMLDIRYIPFQQVFCAIFGATVIMQFRDKIKSIQLLPIIVFLAVALWVTPNVRFIKHWVKWNYEGIEQKATWTLFKNINDHLAKTKDGRVVYEHSPANNTFGSERAFESLPYFAGRYTLEGLYMQSSISSPFIFYIQSEVSKVHSGPFPQYKYAQLNIPAAIPHLKMFNVTQYIVRSPEAKKEAKTVPELKLEKTFKDYEIYRLTTNDGSYVVPLKYEPVLFETDNWKMDFFSWFKNPDIFDIPLVYVNDPDEKDLERFKLKISSLDNLKSVPLSLGKVEIKEQIGPEEVEFTTNLIGQPHLIKVSYHPNWRVDGADRIYQVSPSFMLVYPNQPRVKLYFSKSVFNYLGEMMTLLGLSIVIISGIIAIRHGRRA